MTMQVELSQHPSSVSPITVWNPKFEILLSTSCVSVLYFHFTTYYRNLEELFSPACKNALDKQNCPSHSLQRSRFFPRRSFLWQLPYSLSSNPSLSRREGIRAIPQWAETLGVYLEEAAVKFLSLPFQRRFYSLALCSPEDVNEYWISKLWKTSCSWKWNFTCDSVRAVVL